ncbi:hypothetical protein OY671_007626 [Metschnikowia pulcherrima]|nr:hypothetical protein OY671_007626 [Metschnikowia pulcherrima]
MSASPRPGAKPKSPCTNSSVDYGPLSVFFLAYRHFSPREANAGIGTVVAVTKGTVAFMVATIVASIVSKWRLGRISPMSWSSTVSISGFGTSTVSSGDPFWIQIKPTAIYSSFAGVLFAGLVRGKPMSRTSSQSAFDGSDDAGWMKLSRNWAFFFSFSAASNEVLRHTLSFDGWLQAKSWGVTASSFSFTFAQIPMSSKHGSGAEAADEVEQNPPHD